MTKVQTGKETLVKFRKIYQKHKRVQVLNEDPDNPSRTHQAFKDECDINNIVRKANSTGRLPERIKENPMYGDFSAAPAYQDAMNIVVKANEQFDLLPAETRERFANKPEKFLEFAQDPKNAPEMVKMGLATEREQLNEREPQRDPEKLPKKQPKKDPEIPE